MKFPGKMLDDIAEHARKSLPRECVGLVGVHPDEPDVATARIPLHNHAANPREAFFVEPHEQFKAEVLIEERGLRVGAIYHSHPTTPPHPSMFDMRHAHERLLLICSLAEDEPEFALWDGHDVVEIERVWSIEDTPQTSN